MESPDVRYVKNGDINIAYATVGDGPFDLVFVPGWILTVFESDDEIGSEAERFLTEVWQRGEWQSVEPDRVLATVLFTDIVGSTRKLSELGDERWRRLLNEHHARVRRPRDSRRGARRQRPSRTLAQATLVRGSVGG